MYRVSEIDHLTQQVRCYRCMYDPSTFSIESKDRKAVCLYHYPFK